MRPRLDRYLCALGLVALTAGPAAAGVVVDIGLLEDEGSITIELTASVDSPVVPGTTQVANQGVVSGTNFTALPTDDPDAAGSADATVTPIQVPVDLVVSATDLADPVVAGSGPGNLTQVVTVTNGSAETATGVVLSVPMTTLAGVSVRTVTPSQGIFTAPAWSVGTLGPGAVATLTVVFDVGASATAATDAVCVSSSVTAANETLVATADDTATECTSVSAGADLSVTLVDDADPPTGSQLTYTMTVYNHGPSDAVQVVVTDALPTGLTYAGNSCGAGPGAPWTWHAGTLGAGAMVACDLTVTIDPNPPAAVSNTVSVTSEVADSDLADNTATEDTILDAEAPTVVGVQVELVGTGAEPLEECRTLTDPVSRLRVTFSEPMLDPPGDSTANDVTNPSSYLLVTPGPDLDFATLSCAGVAGDDQVWPLQAVTYEATAHAATLELGSPLAAGQYRLFVCDALRDAGGNDLDGDEDSVVGGDFQRGFRADPGNDFVNADFDCDLDGWELDAPGAEEIVWDSADSGGADGSGSALLRNLAPGLDTTFTIHQCMPVESPGGNYELRLRHRIDTTERRFIRFGVMCRFFSVGDCLGQALSTVSDWQRQRNTGGAWVDLVTRFSSPAGAVSMRCAMGFDTPSADSFDAYLDSVFLDSSVIFSDGFESGDTSAWSTVTP